MTTRRKVLGMASGAALGLYLNGVKARPKKGIRLKTAAIKDNFQTAPASNPWVLQFNNTWHSGGSLRPGVVRLTSPATGTGAACITEHIDQTKTVDLLNSSIHARLNNTPTSGNASTRIAWIVVGTALENRISIGREADILLCRVVKDGVVTDLSSPPAWHPFYMKWLRLRSDGINVYFETSWSYWQDWIVRWTVPNASLPPLVNGCEGMESVWIGTVGKGHAEWSFFNEVPTDGAPPRGGDYPANGMTGIAFGSLVTQPWNVQLERAAGTSKAMQEVQWSSWETADNTYGSAYIAEIQSFQSSLLAQHGPRLTLNAGPFFSNAPSWLGSISNSKLVPIGGTASSYWNFIFNPAMRAKAEEYLVHLDGQLGVSNNTAYDTIRITGGGIEVLYPNGDQWWAGDALAQGDGSGLPATMMPNPFPGWVPGTAGRTVAETRDWLQWYFMALCDAANWQMRFWRARGFRGWFQIVAPGLGSWTYDVDSQVSALLSIPAGFNTTRAGASWPYIYQGLYDHHGVIVHDSGVADISGNPLYNFPDPPNDINVDINNSAFFQAASAARRFAYLAWKLRLPMSGENPGWGDADAARYSNTSKTTASMGWVANQQIRRAGGVMFDHAHSDRLHNSTPGQGMPLSFYADLIDDTQATSLRPVVPAPALVGSLPSPIHGMYLGWDAGYPLNTGVVDAYASANALPIKYGHEFGDSAQWSYFSNGTNFDHWDAWVAASSGRRFTYSAPLLAATNIGDYAGLNAGTYDTYFTQLGQAFQSHTNLQNAIIRLGWEFNGNTFPWRIVTVPTASDAQLTTYKNGYNRAASLIKAQCPTVKFEWCPNLHLDAANRTFTDMYPGDTYVDYVGAAVYDYYWPGGTPTDLQRYNWIVNDVNGLQDQFSLAQSHGKPIAFTEWGLWPSNNQSGGGDRPAFINMMADWMQSHGAAYTVYNNVNATQDARLNSYPNAKATYINRFTVS